MDHIVQIGSRRMYLYWEILPWWTRSFMLTFRAEFDLNLRLIAIMLMMRTATID